MTWPARLALALAWVVLAPLWLCVVAGQVVAIWSGSLPVDAPEVFRTARWIAGDPRGEAARRARLRRRERGRTSEDPL